VTALSPPLGVQEVLGERLDVPLRKAEAAERAANVFITFGRRHSWDYRGVDVDTQRHISMLRILYGACAAALDAFRAANNPIDAQLVADLEEMVERTRGELERLSAELSTST
jgi:hypothetical protein